MSNIISITSQGQISIPARIRRNLGMSTPGKAHVKQVGNKVVVEPIKDFLQLKGSLKKKALENKSLQEIIDLEEKTIQKSRARKNK